tara:strand:+ start:1079 stop:1807 length:729 start_codon:yes stop_codon:yes gene_type:complete
MANSFSKFRELVATGAKEPARSNLYSVIIDLPQCLLMNDRKLRSDQRSVFESINYFADDVTVPGKRITTGQIRDVGQQRNFATDTASTDITCSFIVTKDLIHRELFEKWMQYTASDAENRVTLYDEYTTNILISKWELGSNIVWHGISREGKQYEQRLNRSTGVWQMFGAFPYDMSALSFNNGQTDLLKLDISFYYERYRFDTIGGEGTRFDAGDRHINYFNESANIMGYDVEQKDVSRYGV